MIKRLIICILIVLNLQGIYAQTTDSSIIRTIDEFLSAPMAKKGRLEKKIIQLNPDFDYVFNRLKHGKHYSDDVQTGFFEHCFKNNLGVEYPTLVFIPYRYDPEKKYKVKIYLHGGVSNFDKRQIFDKVNRVDTSWNSVNTIFLFPTSWLFSMWWSYRQYENISNLLNYIKGTYNVDENDVYISGVSDGATGVYYLSNFYQTPFSCFLPYIGSMRMLPTLIDKQFYIRNYQGLSFLIVNGKKDEIFDIQFVVSSVNELKKTAKEVKFIVVDSSKHSTRWYPVLKDTITSFINTHKRNPYPDNIYYATEKPDTFCRKFWVKIDKIGKSKGGALEDLNQITFNGGTVSMFPRTKLFGQIEVSKLANCINVKTQNVKKYTLLISPDQFDVSKPIEVYTNDILSFEGILPKNLKTLLKYYTEDNDRTMLFSSELTIAVGKPFKR